MNNHDASIYPIDVIRKTNAIVYQVDEILLYIIVFMAEVLFI